MEYNTGILLLDNQHKSRTYVGLELIGDMVIGYKYCLVVGSKRTNDDLLLQDAWNETISALLEKEMVDFDEFNVWANENAFMTYHDFKDSGGIW